MHESVMNTYKEMVIKENEGFQLVLKKHKVLSPKGLFSVNLEQQSLKNGEVVDTNTYNFFMTEKEMQSLAYGLTA